MRSALCALACAFVASSASLQAQTSDDDDVVKVRTDLLVFAIRVRDQRTVNEKKLTERDLSLIDPDQIISSTFLYPGAERVALLFALDESGSVRDVVAQQRDAALSLFDRFGSRSRVAVLRFAQQPALVMSFDRDTASARAAFSFPVRSNEHTAIFDAAAAAVNAFAKLPRIRSERRIVILISDGLDTASATKASAVIKAAVSEQVSFYMIQLPLLGVRDGRVVVRSAAKGFRELAEKTGGKYFLVGNGRSMLGEKTTESSDGLAAVFTAIEEDLRSQYLLGLYAGDKARDGRNHRIILSLPAGLEYQVGTQGYARSHKFLVNMPAAEARAPLR